MDSDASSYSEEESDSSKGGKKDSSDAAGSATGEGGKSEKKLYGSQMKVAAKHMKNLPPR